MKVRFDIHRGIRAILCACAVLFVLTSSAPVQAGASEDAVRKVGMLMQQQRWSEAVEVAREAPVREATRAGLLGLIAMRTGAFDRAIKSFERALELGPKRPTLYLYLAWSHYSIGEAEQARAALENVKGAKARVPLYWLLRGRLARDAGDSSGAYAILREGHERYPRDRPIARELGYVLVSHGALDEARRFLVPALSGGDDVGVWSDAMRLLRVLTDRGRYTEAIFYTEILRASLPERASEIDALAAHLYARTRRPVSAAKLFARASLVDGERYAFEAADQFRLARMTSQALRWNSRVSDDERRFEQRFLILTEAGRWARAAAVGRKLDAAGRLSSNSLQYRYGLALTLGLRDMEAARRVVRRLDGAPEAERLREVVERCEREPWRCR
jgi:tetratricopeptide (TPR) repeat protein